ncbi:hypothetical protein DSO57_1011082 [Entomophthora muscae]|uniref:Uncharacterized protein n=1 Tax=Entomophthora muscae TaxID=34485 RepID=A0ACC2SJF8_9FUNG|nr:hypothetical protein DSO57_1011082 [Entomophthora muscae]
MAVSAKSFVYYQTNPDFINEYSYSHILGGLLDSWDGLNSKYRVFLSHQMEGSSTALEAIQGRGHQASVYPTSHADIHLIDVVLFNIWDTVWERHPQVLNDLYLGVLDHCGDCSNRLSGLSSTWICEHQARWSTTEYALPA